MGCTVREEILVTSRTSLHALIACIVLFSSGAALGADEGKSAPAGPVAPTPAARQQMAAIHEKMAACLRSDRPIADCRAEMLATCQATMGQTGCPMLGAGGRMGRGMMGSGWVMGPGMMQGGAPPQKPPN